MEVEELCLYCSSHVLDGRTYCSDECERLDGHASSDSPSASSSAFSSPNLNPSNHGQDVPALVSSALGRALRSTTHHSHTYSRRDKKALSVFSSTSEEDEDDHRVYFLPTPGSQAKSPNMRPIGMQYARRPSGTNKRSTIPLLLGGSTAPTKHQHNHYHIPSDHEDLSSEHSSIGRSSVLSGPLHDSTATVTNSSNKRNRNRTSLPAHFQLLAISPSHPAAYSRSSSTNRTMPPSSSSFTSTSPSPAARPLSVHEEDSTPARGRRRHAGEPCVAEGRIRSRSRRRSPVYETDADASELELDFDFEQPAPAPTYAYAQGGLAMERGRWRDNSRDTSAMKAPGYGMGRSGLRGRETCREDSSEGVRRGRNTNVAIRT